MVRAAQKGEGASSPEVAQVAASIKKKDAKDFASTKHKGLPMKKEEFDLEEGMSLKDFKANRRKLKRKEASTDAKKRGHVGKEWYNSGQTYSPDEAKSGRAKMDDEERSTRKRSAIDPDAEDSDYSADKTKNPKKLRKQKAMGESMINEEDYDRMKDRRMERGGVGGNNRYDRPPAKKLSNAELGIKPGKTQLQKDSEKKHGKGASALDIVKAQIRAKHGDKAIMDTKKKANEGYAPGDVDQKVGAVTAIPKSERDAAKERLLKKAAAKRAALKKEEVENVDEIYMVTPQTKKSQDKPKKKETWYDRDERKRKSQKEEVIHEDEYRKLMAQERKAEKEKEAKRAGRKSINPGKQAASIGKDYANSQMNFHKKVTGKTSTTEEIKFAGNYQGPLYAPHPDLGEAVDRAKYEKIAKEPAPKDDKKAAYAFKDNKNRQRDLKKLARLVRHADGQRRNPAMYNSFEPEGEQINEMPYQVYGSPDGKKEKKIGKPVKSRKYAADRASELEDTHKKTGGKYRSEYTEETIVERGDFWHPDPDKDRKLGGPGANQRAREDRADAAKPKKDYSKTTKPGESYMDYAKRKKAETSKRSTKYPPEIQKRLDAAKSKKKEGIVGKIARKIGLKKEGVITYKEFIAEGNRTGRMMQKSKTQVSGHISADRGDDEKKNREGRKTLEKDLKKHGIGHKKGVGEYKYGSGETGREVSYQTSKPDKMSKRRFGKVMRRLGRKHGQESVITKDKDKSAKLHYTEKGSKAKSDSIGKTKAGKHPEGYGETSGTKVRGGKLPKKTTKGAYHYG